MKLTPAEAARLYRVGQSACEIAADHGLTRVGVESRIRAGGLGGLQWCPIHHTHERVSLINAEAYVYHAPAGGLPQRPAPPAHYVRDTLF